MISSLGFRGVATGQLRICSRATTTYLRSWIESDVLSRLFNQFFPGAGAGFDGGNADPHDLEFPRRQGYPNGTATSATSSPTSAPITSSPPVTF